MKSLDPPWSKLPTGLVPDRGTAHPGLTSLSLAAQSLAVEARLLAGPVSFELVSTAHAEESEDRATMALAAEARLTLGQSAGDPAARGNGIDDGA